MLQTDNAQEWRHRFQSERGKQGAQKCQTCPGINSVDAPDIWLPQINNAMQQTPHLRSVRSAPWLLYLY